MTDTPNGAKPDSRALPVVIAGAGLAGLTCALALHDVGQPVLLLEASDGVGGRVRSDRTRDGFIIDRGFQVLLDAYPAARRWVDYEAIRALPFDGGAHVWTGKRLVPLANPLLHPEAVVRDATSSLFGFADKVRLAKLAVSVLKTDWQSAAEAAQSSLGAMSAETALWASGFSRNFLDRFARPFWGGIQLDPTLEQSAGPMLFTLKMFLEGRAVLPADGVGAMAAFLAARLPADSVRLNARVDALIRDETGAVTGIRSGGMEIPAAAVVVAMDPPAARELTGIRTLPDAGDGLESVTVFLAGPDEPGTGPRLVVNGTGRGVVNHLAPLSDAQPAYARHGMSLLAAVAVGEATTRDDDALAELAHVETAAMLGQRAGDWRVVAVRRVPFSQFSQRPGVYSRLPGNEPGPPGLFLASEATVDSSYNGAMLSGEGAARAVLRTLARQGRGATRRQS
jgi:phytoene dehydrogenase-like protein